MKPYNTAINSTNDKNLTELKLVPEDDYQTNTIKEEQQVMHDKFMHLLGGHIYFQLMYAAVELDLFTILATHGPSTRARIERLIKIDSKPARALLLGLVSAGLLEKTGSVYGNTKIAEKYLSSSSVSNLIACVKWQHEIVYKPMYHLTESLKQNINVGICEIKGEGSTLYERLRQNPDLELTFQNAMQSLSSHVHDEFLEIINLTATKHLVDIGGGNATNVIALAKKFTHINGSVFDLQTVCDKAVKNIEKHKLTSRLNAIEGNCFNDELPKNVDAFLLSHFCTIWSEEDNFRLFQKCFDALPKEGKLFVFNMVQDDDQCGPPSAAIGSPYFIALATGGGFLYTVSEYKTWLQAAGFTIESVKCVSRDHALFTAVKK